MIRRDQIGKDEAMSQFTKTAMIQSFVELLNETPFEKITVTDIVERCGVNRNTFYYYYQDIYALLDELLFSETEKILRDTREYTSWQEAFLEGTQFAQENKRAVYHIYNSVSREKVEQYLYDVTRKNMLSFVRSQAKGLRVQEGDLAIISDFYAYALVGSVLQWLGHGMREDPSAFIRRVSELFDGNIRYTLQKSMSKPAQAGADPA